MTLTVRNKLIKTFLVISILYILTIFTAFLIALLNKAITPPPTIRIPSFLDKLSFLKYNFVASILSVFSIMLYVPVTIVFVLFFFERTQSAEVIFFIMFLCGCLCEGVRILIQIFGLWSTFSDLLFFCGRIVFFGRILTSLSFIFASIASDINQRQDIERNLAIISTIAIVFTAIIPLNTAKISSTGTVTWGYGALFTITRIVFLIISFFSFLIRAQKEGCLEFKKIAYFLLVLNIGYSALVMTDNYIFFPVGLILFVLGTFKYLENLHKLYMWK